MEKSFGAGKKLKAWGSRCNPEKSFPVYILRILNIPVNKGFALLRVSVPPWWVLNRIVT
jgi:hypothetical protein